MCNSMSTGAIYARVGTDETDDFQDPSRQLDNTDVATDT